MSSDKITRAERDQLEQEIVDEFYERICDFANKRLKASGKTIRVSSDNADFTIGLFLDEDSNCIV